MVSAFRSPPPVSPLRYPLDAGLLTEDARYDALEFSAAGLSLAIPAVEGMGLQHLRRGDECAVTLYVAGADWQEEYDVVLRLAARGPIHVGFAFVALPPPARRLLERYEAGHKGSETWIGDDASDGLFSSEFDGPAPFAFARLVEPRGAPRRFILPISAAVFTLTQARKQSRPPSESPADFPSPVRRVYEDPPPSARVESVPASTVLVCAVALLVLLALAALMLFG